MFCTSEEIKQRLNICGECSSVLPRITPSSPPHAHFGTEVLNPLLLKMLAVGSSPLGPSLSTGSDWEELPHPRSFPLPGASPQPITICVTF